MKKQNKDKYSITEVGSLIEEFRSDFRAFGEDLRSVKSTVTTIREQVGKNSEDTALLKVAVRNVVAKIDTLTKSIDKLVKTKADREDFQKLESRVAALETKVTTLSR